MEEIVAHIESLAFGGSGICHTQTGKTVFVPHAAPGDTIRAHIVEEKKTYANARLLEIVQPGPARIAPTCPFAGACGGCTWQHITYSDQVFAKRNAVVSALSRIGSYTLEDAESIVAACQTSKHEVAYRNKLELACKRDKAGRIQLGFHGQHSHDFIAVDRCILASKAIQDAPKAVQGALRYVEGSTDLGIFRVGIRYSTRTKALEIALWTKPGPHPRAASAKTLASALPASSIVRVIAEEGKARKVKNVEVLAGHGYWTEDVGEFTYRVSAPSFFQVNTRQAEILQSLVVQGLGCSEDDIVADLYSGVGTFSLPLASCTSACLAVESAKSAVRDLRRNADAASVIIDIIGGDSARELPELGQLDALVVDPPRTGLADGVAQSIAAASPKRVAYVSCNPATWARDVVRLEECGYRLRQATPVDMFPQTYHVEVVSIFERNA